MSSSIASYFLFFFNDTATTEIYTLSLHDALPISQAVLRSSDVPFGVDNMDLVLVDDVLYTGRTIRAAMNGLFDLGRRSEEHTSELQSRLHLVCRLLLEKKKTQPSCSTLRALPSAP